MLSYLERIRSKLATPQKLNLRISSGKLVALLTFSLYFTIYPLILKQLWPLIQDKFSQIPLYLIGITAANVVTVIIYNLVMIFIYRLKHPFLEKYRCNPGSKWPWQVDYTGWKKTLRKSLKVVAFNSLIIGPSVSLVDSLLEFHFKMRTEDAPEVSTMMWQWIFFMFIHELSFYSVHRLFHHPKFYPYHKQHHEYKVTISLAAEYAHPLQHILANTIPTGLGWKLLSKYYPVHIFTIIIFLTFRVIETCDTHSGYDWSWSQSGLFPFNSGGGYHYFHHEKNVGNYSGLFTIMDSIFGTNEDFYQYQEKERKKELQEKGK